MSNVLGQEPYILLFGIIILLFSGICMHYSNRIFNFISLPTIWYFAYTATIFIPSFWTFYERTGYYRYNYIYTMTSPLVTVPIGILLVNAFLKYRTREIIQYHSAAIEDRPKSFVRIMNYLLLLFVAVTLFFLWCWEQESPIPLLQMLTHPESSQDFMSLREYSFKLLDSPIRYFYHLTRDFLFPLLMLVAFGNYYVSRSRTWLFLFILSAIFGLFYAAANISKSPIFSIILLLILNLYILKRGKLSWWQIIVGIVLSLFFPVFVLMSGSGNLSWEGFQQAFGKFMVRIFIAPSSIVYYGFEVVPERYPFQMGRSMGAITKLLGMEPGEVNSFTTWYILGDSYGTTSVSGAFVTQLFGDFGFPGVLIGGVLVGVLMQWLHISIVRKPKTVFAIVTYVLFCHFFWTLTYLQIASALILSGAPILWLLYRTKVLG